jgi:hypothetical protein
MSNRIGPLRISLRGGKTPTPEDLALIPTRGEIPLELNEVTWPDGSPVVLWLRGRSFLEMASANYRAAEYARKHGITEDDAWALLAAKSYIARPEISDAQLHVLTGLNPRIISDIIQAGERIEAIDARLIQSAVEQLAGVATPPAPDAPVPAAAGAADGDAAGGDGKGARPPRKPGGRRPA